MFLNGRRIPVKNREWRLEERVIVPSDAKKKGQNRNTTRDLETASFEKI